MDKPNNSNGVTRRRFLQQTGGSALALSMTQLGDVISGEFINNVLAGETVVEYAGEQDLYRDIWKWDKVTWGTHTNACVPNGCSFRVYTKNGIVWREEQSMRNTASNPDYPDYNPLGCQKGCSFHANLYSEERVTHPMRRVGPRGSGKWERITWDDALTEIAGAIIDGIEEFGPDSFITDGAHFNAGGVGFTSLYRFNTILGGVSPDWNVMNGDIYTGLHDTFGKMLLGYSADNMMDAKLIIMSATNWSYTSTPLYHFITEAKYNGTEFVSIAPDYSPSSIHADYHVPVKPGGDAAFWLGMCQVMIAEDLLDREFMREQTDLALLRRRDNGKISCGKRMSLAKAATINSIFGTKCPSSLPQRRAARLRLTACRHWQANLKSAWRAGRRFSSSRYSLVLNDDSRRSTPRKKLARKPASIRV